MDRVLSRMGALKTRVEARLVLSEAYDVGADIFDHVEDEEKWPSMEVSQRNPFTLDGLHPVFDTERVVDRKSRLRNFINLGIHEKLGIDVLEFMSLPRETLEEIVEVCRASVEEDRQRADNLRKELDELKRKNPELFNQQSVIEKKSS